MESMYYDATYVLGGLHTDYLGPTAPTCLYFYVAYLAAATCASYFPSSSLADDDFTIDDETEGRKKIDRGFKWIEAAFYRMFIWSNPAASHFDVATEKCGELLSFSACCAYWVQTSVLPQYLQMRGQIGPIGPTLLPNGTLNGFIIILLMNTRIQRTLSQNDEWWRRV